VVREHYTRSNGRTVSPCAECQLQQQKDRHDRIRTNPAQMDAQREKWKRYKKIQRLALSPPNPAGADAQPKGIIPQETIADRKARRRRRRRTQRPPASQDGMDSGLVG